jgi:Domain of unknown function (DUF5666)
VEEIKLFKELQPPPPRDAPRMREAARARLTAVTSAPLAHPARRRRSVVVPVAVAAALVAAGTGYGLTAAQGGSSPLPSTATRGGPSPLPSTAAGLAAVRGCPGKYITAGTLEQVNGTQLILQPANDRDHQNRTWRAQPVTVATSSSTVITRPVSGTVSDITDGSQVIVQGTWSGGKLAATEVGIEAALPKPSSFGPRPQHLRKLLSPRGWLGPPIATGTVVDAHDGSFAVVIYDPIIGARTPIQVTTSESTKVVARASASLSQLNPGANVVAVGQIGPHGVLTASTVAEPSVLEIVLAGGPAKIGPSGCSASAITTAAVLAGT